MTKKFRKFIVNHIFGIVLGSFVFGIVGVKATTYLLNSSNVSYDNSNSGASTATVKGSIDLLKQKADSLTTSFTSYSVGNLITVKGEQYYVIQNSGTTQEYVVALKKEPLTTSDTDNLEVNPLRANEYLSKGHVNEYVADSFDGNFGENNGYAGLTYYSSSSCGFTGRYGSLNQFTSDCKTSYNKSDIKYIVDAWETAKFKNNELFKDTNGYTTRLITIDELTSLGFTFDSSAENLHYILSNSSNSWICSSNYQYWTMSSGESNAVYQVSDENGILSLQVYGGEYTSIRPVINVYKSKISS